MYKRQTKDIAAWAFLNLQTLNTAYNAVLDTIDDPEMPTVALAATVDDQGFSTITLNTCNMAIFNEITAGLRNYEGITGFTLETFYKQEFIEKKSATIYVPQRFARFGPRRLFRSLVHLYPGLAAKYEIFH